MNSAVTTVHHWVPLKVVITPAAHVPAVTSEVLPKSVPVVIAVTRSTRASVMLKGIRRMNPPSASAVDRRRPFGSASISSRGARSDRVSLMVGSPFQM
jgi:hypothetical protein